MPVDTGLSKKLSIAACKVRKGGTIIVDNSQTPFEVMINPSNFKRQLTIEYSKEQTLGQSAGAPKFAAICPEGLSMSNLVLDGTGVVGPVTRSVTDMVNALLAVIYQYNGEQHEPNYVRVLWGSFIFFGRVQSISIDYTMFKPSGEPLRAKLSIGFTGWMSNQERALRANMSSPDLSHLVEIKEGDTLPLLCNRIYKDPSYYREIARINNLSNFRKLEPGSVLRFPPLV